MYLLACERMRIAMIGAKGVPATIGGIERHVEELSGRLATAGFVVTVYARAWYIQRTHGTARMHRGVRVVTLASIHTKHLDAISHTILATLHAMRERPDIYHFHGVGPSLCAVLPRLFRPRARVIATFHCVDRRHEKWGAFARAVLAVGEWVACTIPHATIAVGETLAAYCAAQYGRAVTCIPNGVAPAEDRRVPIHTTREALQHLGLVPGTYLLVVSRFVAHKDIHRIIAAVRRVKQERPDLTWLQLAIVGAPAFTDAYEWELQSAAAGDPTIHFLGRRSGAMLNALYANCIAFVHASRSEGLPMVVLEAAAAAAVPLVSDIPEHAEIIAKVGGFLFRAGDTWDLQQKLEVMLAAHASLPKLGRDAQAAVLRHYHWDRITARTAEHYRDVLVSRARRERMRRLTPARALV